MLAGPVGSGVPNAYPLAINTPLDRAYLRPLQVPLYDSEVFDFTTPPTQMTYFQRPISQSTATGTQKFLSETNLNQSAMLDYPREFSILGFTMSMDTTIGLLSQANILRRQFFQFTFSGNRPYLQIRTDRIPAGMGLEGATSQGNVSAGSAGGGVITCFKNGLGHVANYYKFNLGRSALKIKPGEAFNANLNWPVAVGTGAGLSTINNVYGSTQTSPAGWWLCVSLIGCERAKISRMVRPLAA